MSRTNEELERDIDVLWRTVQGYRAASSSDRQSRLDEFAKTALHLAWESYDSDADIAAAAYDLAEFMLAESDRRAKEDADG